MVRSKGLVEGWAPTVSDEAAEKFQNRNAMRAKMKRAEDANKRREAYVKKKEKEQEEEEQKANEKEREKERDKEKERVKMERDKVKKEKQKAKKKKKKQNKKNKKREYERAAVSEDLVQVSLILAEDDKVQVSLSKAAEGGVEMSVQEYLDKHLLSRKIEDAINATVRAKAADPVLFISNHLKKDTLSIITKIIARQIFDSRGIPTVEVDLHTNKGMFRASVPSGMWYEAVDLRDEDTGTYLGHGVTKAVEKINDEISKVLIGMDPTLQSQIDHAMLDLDKTKKKGELGANAILAVSIASCKAGAAEKEVALYKHIADLFGKPNITLPVPAFTVISGGMHAGNSLAIQEINILPTGASKYKEALQMGFKTYHCLKEVIKEKWGLHGCNVGEDGGFAPNISSLKEGLELVKEAISKAGYNDKIKMAIDVAASSFCIGTKYDIDFKSLDKAVQNLKSGKDMTAMYKDICAEYPIVSIEDPFDKEDWEHTKDFSGLGLCQVVGDDLLMSNPKRIERAIRESTCNALHLKIRTVTQAIEAVKLAKDAHWGVVMSSCGETEDSFIADLSVGLATGLIKAGAPCRVEQYNQLLRIEEELGDQAVYAGDDWKPT